MISPSETCLLCVFMISDNSERNFKKCFSRREINIFSSNFFYSVEMVLKNDFSWKNIFYNFFLWFRRFDSFKGIVFFQKLVHSKKSYHPRCIVFKNVFVPKDALVIGVDEKVWWHPEILPRFVKKIDFTKISDFHDFHSCIKS